VQSAQVSGQIVAAGLAATCPPTSRPGTGL